MITNRKKNPKTIIILYNYYYLKFLEKWKIVYSNKSETSIISILNLINLRLEVEINCTLQPIFLKAYTFF